MQAAFPGTKQREAILFCRVEVRVVTEAAGDGGCQRPHALQSWLGSPGAQDHACQPLAAHHSPCRGQVVSLLEDNLKATPEQLGDAARESADELTQRHERVTAATLLALAALADAAAPTDATAAADALSHPDMSASGATDGQGGIGPTTGAAGSSDQQAQPDAQLLQRVAAIVNGSGFWKRLYGSKSPMVRQAAYTFTARLAAR